MASIGLLTLRRELRVPPWLWVAFTLPFILLVLQLLFNIREPHPAIRLAADVLFTANVLTLPVIFWMIARLLAPRHFALPARRP